MDFVKGDLIKINSDLFNREDLTEMFGDLGYVGALKFLTFEVMGEVKDSLGDLYECTITNPDELLNHLEGATKIECTGSWYILKKDAIRANTKVTLDYELLNSPSFNKDEVIKNLFSERDKLKKAGRAKNHKTMTDNWRKIRIARGELKPSNNEELKLVAPQNDMIEVGLLKQGIKLSIKASDLPKDQSEEEIKRFKLFLSSCLRKFRASQKSVNDKETKSVEVYKTRYTLTNGVHSKPGEIFLAYKTFMKNAFETEKKPQSKKDNYVGIELEIVYSGNIQKLKDLMMERRLHRYVMFHRDDSVRACHNTGYTGLELTVLCKESELSYVLTKLNECFEDPEIDAYVNRSCGLHVHLDMRQRDHKLAFTNLVRTQDLMRAAQPRGRINNIHCRPNESDVFRIINDRGDRQDRYWVVNPNSYEKHTTLEIRVHEGTLNGSDIFNWIKFLISVADHKEKIPQKKYKLASDLVTEGIKIPTESISYMDSRITKYKSLPA